MKKRVLFVIESLVCAGGEKSLTTLLNLFDYDKYDVDLQLFRYGGEFEELLPKQVELLPPLEYFVETQNSIFQQIKNCIKSPSKFKILFSRISYSIQLRLKKTGSFQQAVIFWKAARKSFKPSKRRYDIAVAYAQGAPTFYIADCVNANKKIAWINAIYVMEGKYKDFSIEKYDKYNKISCVSDTAYEEFVNCFPMFKSNTFVTKDINDGNFIKKMSLMKSNAKNEMQTSDGVYKILTVGRFAWPKGYDIATEACKILKEKGIKFKWFVLGKGPKEQEIRQYVRNFDIEDCFILLGTRANPYPYFYETDIYVQTSKMEGYGLTIAEARVLNKPVVTTRFDSVYAQMIDGENGLVVDMNAQAVADGVEKLINNVDLYNHIVEYQKQETKCNYEELDKFYSLID